MTWLSLARAAAVTIAIGSAAMAAHPADARVRVIEFSDRSQYPRAAVDATGRLFVSGQAGGGASGLVRTFDRGGTRGPDFAAATIANPIDVTVETVSQDLLVLEGDGKLARFSNDGTQIRWTTTVTLTGPIWAHDVLAGPTGPILIATQPTDGASGSSLSRVDRDTGAPLSAANAPDAKGRSSVLGPGRFVSTGGGNPTSITIYDDAGATINQASASLPGTSGGQSAGVSSEFGLVVAKQATQTGFTGPATTVATVTDSGVVAARFDTAEGLGYSNTNDVAIDGDRVVWLAGSGRDSEALMRIDTATPTASLVGPAGPISAGAPLRLNASASTVALGSVSRFEWDTDGDGSFDTDTGTTPTIDLSSTQPRKHSVAVRVTGRGDAVDSAAGAIDVRPASPPGPAGVSINAGSRYTNDQDVTLGLRWPSLAEQLFVSNDGGFGALQTFPVAPAIPWKLDSSGPERLPKTVYLRFTGGTAGPETYQDDIILDETPPTVQSASATIPAAGAAGAAAKRKVAVRLKATDATSGVAFLQVGEKRSPALVKRRYTTRLTLRSSAKRLYVRVIDTAGNISRWRTFKVAAKKRKPRRRR